jgi:hypothetical protein
MFNRLQFQTAPALLLSSSMAVLLAACGGGNGADPTANSTAAQDQLAASTITGQDTTAMEAVTPPQPTLLAASTEFSAATATTPNLALSKPVSVSSSESSSTVGVNAVDGQGTSRWSSQFSDTQWIRVDLGANMPVNRVVLQWEDAHAKSYLIQASSDGSNWRTVYTNGNSYGGIEDARFTATTARYVRMLGTQRATAWGYSLYEFQVYNSNATTTPAPTPAPAPSGNPLPTDAIFAPSSFWYQVIPTNVALHPNSAGFVSDFLRQVRTYYGNVAVNTTSYASPVFQPAAGIATTKVTQWDCQNKGYLDSNLASQWSAVPIPSNATPSDGTDGEMTIYQPSSNTIWEFWQTRKVSGQWQACWGGRMTNVKSSNGIWQPGFGTTATGLPFIGGQITAEELKRGEIRHAIGIALVDLERSGVFSWPANRSDGYNPNGAANRIPEGTRFRLDPSVNVNSLNIHPVAKTIARAAQKYGFVVWDKAGAISLRVQNPKSYTALGQPDPYAALFNGTQTYALMNGFPWDKLQFLPKDYGKQ